MAQESTPVSDPPFRFTESQDWFSHNIEHWRRLFPIITAEAPRVLEIGSWEGRSAVFLATELCKDDGQIVCIDHFDLFRTDAGKERYALIQYNLALTGKRFRVLPQFSFPALMKLLEEEMIAADAGYHWIYVDGSHRADDTLLDGELAWRLAKEGAVVIFDDYNWDKEPEDSIHHPKRGIDAFLDLHKGEYELLSQPHNYQVVLKKTSEMRIGFLVSGLGSTRDDSQASTFEALEYGINVVTVADSAYAMPASVAMASVVQHTLGRLSIYVVDSGLSPDDRQMIERSVPKRDNVTLNFILLKDDCLAKKWNATWAKVDLPTILPVERALYLDADTLVRGDITELWNTDLGGKLLGAAVDVGYPMGHDGVQRRPYFNSGVLLLDLTKIRLRLEGWRELCERFKDAKLGDQDALNEHFADDWKQLSLRWNAQGLGTYAEFYSPDRHVVDVAEMRDPTIVHFTGPLHPSLAEVLNPFVRPYTAKPWGYAGGPGHPFAKEWEETVENSAWSEFWRGAWRDICGKAREKALADAKVDFAAKLALNNPL